MENTQTLNPEISKINKRQYEKESRQRWKKRFSKGKIRNNILKKTKNIKTMAEIRRKKTLHQNKIIILEITQKKIDIRKI